MLKMHIWIQAHKARAHVRASINTYSLHFDPAGMHRDGEKIAEKIRGGERESARAKWLRIFFFSLMMLLAISLSMNTGVAVG